ncbi:MAG: pyridoxal phosphate-dependent aminotransferase family protein [Proteobacteria bacterium]|nr:MAG: pyridoxal phosphate-dependent aminotransferase family protein [Pseudomonadota bacterium]
MDLFDKCHAFQDARMLQQAGVYPFFRALEGAAGPRVVSDGQERVMVGSNNYLGLTQHPRVIKAAQDALEKYGTGCTGSRFLNGNTVLHETLEAELAAYLQRESVLVYATGFMANLGAISAIVGRKDIIFSDRENHASIVEGQSAALGETIKYKHNDMGELERVLREYEHVPGKLIVFDGVFSMTGRIVNLPEIVRLAKKYNARTYCDCAHGLGVLGPAGRGTPHHFGLNDEVDLMMGTFSKSFASLGGFVAGKKDIIHYIKHKSRAFMFSASLPPASAAAVLECVRIIQEEPEMVEKLWKNARKMKAGFEALGFDTMGTQTPVIPVLIGDDLKAFMFVKRLYELGVFATPVVSPAVPKGYALIRTSYMSTHEDKDLDFVLDVFAQVGREFGIINPQ